MFNKEDNTTQSSKEMQCYSRKSQIVRFVTLPRVSAYSQIYFINEDGSTAIREKSHFQARETLPSLQIKNEFENLRRNSRILKWSARY